jgi:hypothetical protein
VVYGLCLLIGAVLFGVAGLLHPMLEGDGAAQLATIAATPGWRAIHWGLLFALPLLYVGLSGVALRHGETAGATAARGGIRLAAFAFAVWSLNILFMAAGGWSLARVFTASDTGLTASHAVFVYDMLHPAGLAAERLATFAVGLVVYLFARAMLGGGLYPRWLAWTGFAVAAITGVIGLVVAEWTPNPYYYGQALVIVWLALTGVVTLRAARSPRA